MDHFNFITEDTVLASAIQGKYIISLVFLSIVIAILASYVAFSVSEKIRGNELTPRQHMWWATGALVQGTGIWAMHFIAMLAFTLPFPVNYELWLTTLSVIPATLASAVALRTNNETTMSPGNFVLRSILMGGGIGLMHYIGMAAMLMENATMAYDLNLFVLSILVAIILAGVALRLKIWAEDKRTRVGVPEVPLLISAAIMGIAIAAMHYTAMAATYFFPADHTNAINIAIPTYGLAWIIGIVTMAIIVVMVIAVYISQRLELVNMLEKSEARIRAIISNTAEAIIAINENGIIETFNNAAEEMFGYSSKEIIGKSVALLLPEDQREQHDSYTKNSSMYESRIINKNRELQGVKKNGNLFPIALNVSPMIVDDKKGFVGVIRDISEQQINDQIILQAKNEAERASQAKSEFLSHMSHELRTPMNTILGFSELLNTDKENPLNKEQNVHLTEIISAGKHLLSLINEVLDLARIESGKIKLEIEPISVSFICNECVSLMKGMAFQYDVNIVNMITQDTEVMVYADYLRLKQILLNLLSNAIKYGKKEGAVTISCSNKENNHVRINVTDTGRGLTEQQQQRIFMDFEQINTAYETSEGVGIGLSISKQLTEYMNGSIGVESTPGEGSSFWIDFPVCVKSSDGLKVI